ncbi:hypothetical protein GCM10023403_20930 [Pseudonocardia benzenivorans]|nr:hypothetical protein PSD17_56910 [Pseudonocardia sp. D17]
MGARTTPGSTLSSVRNADRASATRAAAAPTGTLASSLPASVAGCEEWGVECSVEWTNRLPSWTQPPATFLWQEPSIRTVPPGRHER